ncbi:MAG: hypothetical protein K9K88_14150 [Desulfobacterales bacterium]|nr:hypothetical protein [Desulfobacterales bacterium]
MFKDRFSSKFSMIIACMMVVSLLAFTPAFAGDELSKEAQVQASQSQPASVADAAEGAASVEAAGAAGAAGGLMTTNALVVGGAVFGTAAVLGATTSAANDNGTTAAHP